eukprot:CAMPEP_0198722814 /NCGR_PEP_ID=MMETSP1475-20131203/426_1 /TAXON_ID= ORGANISM="Unidentified sp., Strain CCMP1999" /NCGR_SAMPLE_ID=MMETSP1475 /ASSEMBLY_ACC=CAM_ASM_001111 /LENGTH=297 /DNA_ID=CAMNT_0044483737 /DNA_START=252 /DNA_END=1145 /DNA_ORIENTATION=-
MTIEFVGQEDQVKRAASQSIRDPLPRRSVKTVLYYMKEFHDGANEKWLRKFEEFDKKEKDFMDWEGYLVRMFQAVPVTGKEVFAHPKGNFRREYTFTIDPSRIAQRVLATREHLAREWTEDLRLLDMENLEITRMHYELAMNAEADLDPLKQRILDVDVFDSDSSPLRIGSYHQLRAMATHYAVHRLLQRMKQRSNHHFMWLSEYIVGHSITPDSEKFLYSLLKANAEYRKNPDTYISPRKVATMIMNCRAAVSRELITDLESVKAENLTVQRKVLEERTRKSFGGFGSEEGSGNKL